VDELFDDPGDLGFFDIKEDEPIEQELENPLFESPLPGEEED